MVHEAGYTLG